MAEPHEPVYKITFVYPAIQKIRDLDEQAQRRGTAEAYRNTLTVVMGLLQTQPTVWGDPVRNTHFPGGVVYRGLKDALVV